MLFSNKFYKEFICWAVVNSKVAVDEWKAKRSIQRIYEWQLIVRVLGESKLIVQIYIYEGSYRNVFFQLRQIASITKNQVLQVAEWWSSGPKLRWTTFDIRLYEMFTF